MQPHVRAVWSLALIAALAVACSGGTATPATKTPLPVSGATPSAATGATSTAASGATAAPGGPGSIGQTVAKAADLAKALGPGDFAAVGLSGAGPGSDNTSDPTSHYVVYAGKSSGTGGIEYDAFVSVSVTDAQATYATVQDGALDSQGMGKRDVPTADDAAMRLDNPIDAGHTFATVAVRKGLLVFDIGVPSGPTAEAQLAALANLVLARTAAVQ